MKKIISFLTIFSFLFFTFGNSISYGVEYINNSPSEQAYNSDSFDYTISILYSLLMTSIVLNLVSGRFDDLGDNVKYLVFIFLLGTSHRFIDGIN